MLLSKFGRQLTTDEEALTMSDLQLFSVNLLRDRHPALFLTSSSRKAKFKNEKPRKDLVLMRPVVNAFSVKELEDVQTENE